MAKTNLQDIPKPPRSKRIEMELDFEMLRGERRSFFCPNKLWKELQKRTRQYFKNTLLNLELKSEVEEER